MTTTTSGERLGSVVDPRRVEAEIDRVLTRKMEHRDGPGFTPLALDELVASIGDLIRARTGASFSIVDAAWLHGGASKIQVKFAINWDSEPEDASWRGPMVLRMDPPASIVETSRRREAEVLRALEGRARVPRCFWWDATGEFLPYPGLVFQFVEGVGKPTRSDVKKVSGVGTNFGDPGLRATLGEQFVEALALTHTTPLDAAALPSFEIPATGTAEGAIRQVNWWARVWDEDRYEDVPVADVAIRWLLQNAPTLDVPSLVHGDFRSGNFLYLEDSGQMTGVLDWELAVIGDRHQDLAWATVPHFGHEDESGQFLASGLLPVDDLLSRYEAQSGLTVDLERLRYFRIFNSFTSVVHMVASARRVTALSKTHQDVVVAWLSMIGPIVLDDLRVQLEGVIR